MNRVTLIGRIVEDPKRISDKVTKLRLATNERYQDKDKNWKDSTEYHTVVIFGARTVLKDLYKGVQVLVDGKLRTSPYEARDGGGKRYSTEVVADEVILMSEPRGNAPSSRKEDEYIPPTGGDDFDEDSIPF